MFVAVQLGVNEAEPEGFEQTITLHAVDHPTVRLQLVTGHLQKRSVIALYLAIVLTVHFLVASQEKVVESNSLEVGQVKVGLAWCLNVERQL